MTNSRIYHNAIKAAIYATVLATAAKGQTVTNGTANFLGPLGVNQNITFNQVAAPSTGVTTALGGAGNVTGTRYYCVTFVTSQGETNLGPYTGTGSQSCDGIVIVGASSNVVNITNVPVSTDNRVIGRNIYAATGLTNFYYRLTAGTTIANNTATTYTDNTAAPFSTGPIWGIENTTSNLIYQGATPVGFIGKNTTVFGSVGALNMAKSTLAPVGNFMTAFGAGALGVFSPLATSQYNSAFGAGALGSYPGTNDPTDGQNTAVGVVACGGLLTGHFNTCLGGHTGRANSTYSRSTFVGATSFLNVGSGGGANDNTGLGFAAGTNMTTGGSNLFAGAWAGAGVAGGYAGTNPCANAANDVNTVAQTTLLGPCTGIGSATQVQNAIAIGYNATVNASNTGVIGNSSVTDVYFGGTGGLASIHAANIGGAGCTSSASPAVCAATIVGSVAIASGGTTLVVNTTAVGANSEIMVTEDQGLGAKLGVTCNTQSLLIVGPPRVTARSAGTSFTIGVDVALTANPMCVNFQVIN